MKNLIQGIVLAIVLTSATIAQDTHVEIAKRSRAIPKSCELVTPATLEPSIDVPALIKEAICKGAGDMLGEYTYTVNSLKREKGKKGEFKDETFGFEVFIPTLKGGMRTKGVLVVTSHNGVAVPPEELEKARVRAAEKIEKEEERIERNAPAGTPEPTSATGMLPLGMYTRMTLSRSAFGIKSGGGTFAIATFLRSGDLTLARRDRIAGRDTLIFNFTPRPDAQFTDNEKYIAKLTGEIWIDVADRIVTRVIGWPASAAEAKDAVNPGVVLDPTSGANIAPWGARVPAIYLEMMPLPQQRVWLPHVIHINGVSYPTLFDGIKTISTSMYSNYVRFTTEVKGAEIKPPQNP